MFFRPQGLALDGDVLYVADTENHLVRAANLATRRVTTLAGTGKQAAWGGIGGLGRETALNSPWDLDVRRPAAVRRDGRYRIRSG